MCGIAGYYRNDGVAIDINVVAGMQNTLVKRGPDACGSYSDDRVGFGFRRLSILDLSEEANQPMTSPDGTCVLVFNGEIYNFLELRLELEARGHRFRTRTDTEVILAAYLEYGRKCVERFNGMWAFALWDRRTQELFCSRDRFGEKPFYYFWNGRTFVFASEIKALLVHPDVPRRENQAKVFEYVAFAYLDRDDQTLFDRVFQMRPGTSLVVRGHELQHQTYWSPPLDTVHEPWETAVEQYRELFLDAVKIRLRSDVPQGLLLSGGQDSSAIGGAIAMLRDTCQLGAREQIIEGKLCTFSSCYEDPALDERRYVEAVIRKCGFHAHYVYPTSDDSCRLFKDALWAHDEPLSTSNSLAHSKLLESVSAAGIKVLLSGQGADEVLAGYDRFVVGYVLRDALARGDFQGIKNELAAFNELTGLSYGSLAAQAAKSFLPIGIIPTAKAAFVERTDRSIENFFGRSRRTRFTAYYHGDPSISHVQAYLRSTLMHNTLPRIVHYEDRGAMQHSVEERFPFLDYRLVEFALRQPTDYLVKNGLTKRILRFAVKDLLPPEIQNRTTKIGFATPTLRWVRQLLGTEEVRAAILHQRSDLLKPSVLRMLATGDIPPRQDQFSWRVVNYLYWRQLFRVY
jgi:asparagine synthase (glutamine-hydrolysing)